MSVVHIDPSGKGRRPLSLVGAAVLVAALVTALITGLWAGFGAGFGTALLPPAQAAPTTELTAAWEPAPPDSIRNGDTVRGVFRLNLNDPQSGEEGQRDNVLAEISLTRGVFPSRLPPVCRTAGVTPASRVSADGSQLTCNVGTMRYGTAKVVSFAAVAEGPGGGQLSAVVSTDGAPDVPLDPIPIVSLAALEVTFDTDRELNTPATSRGFVEYPFGLALPVGAETLDGPITFDLTAKDVSGPSAISGPAALELDSPRCGPLTGTISRTIPGTAEAPLPTTCRVNRVGPGHWRVLLDGYKDTLAGAPTHATNGDRLPVDRTFFGAGVLRFRTGAPPGATMVWDLEVGRIRARSDYGNPITRDWRTANNTERAIVRLGGNHQNAWMRQVGGDLAGLMFPRTGRNALYHQGDDFDGTPVALPGAEVLSTNRSRLYEDVPRSSIPAGARLTLCTTVDRFASAEFTGRLAVGGSNALRAGAYSAQVLRGPVRTGSFDCTDNASLSDEHWVPTAMTKIGHLGGADAAAVYRLAGDPAKVTAVRLTLDPRALRTGLSRNERPIELDTSWRIRPRTTGGTDVWTLGSSSRAGGGFHHHGNHANLTPTRGDKYPATTVLRDVLHVVAYQPHIDKAVSQEAPHTGDTVTYRLRSSLVTDSGASGRGDYTLTDTLPVGLGYLAGSAVPAPAKVRTVSGKPTVLVWRYHQVPTNVVRSIRYRARIDYPEGVRRNVVVAETGQPRYRPTRENHGIAEAAVNVVRSGQTILTKSSSQAEFASGGSDVWQLTPENDDRVSQAVTDVIDILPFNGDGRGTHFSGGYSIDSVSATAGHTVLYTTTAPAQLSPDPSDPTNGAFGSPSSLWTAQRPEEGITGIRFLGTELAVGATARYAIAWTPTGSHDGDRFVNYAWAKTTHTQLRMIRAADSTVTVAASRLQVDKTTDATSVEAGDIVEWVLTARNAGPGEATGVVVHERPRFGLDPRSVRLVGAPSKGSFEASSGTWTIGDLASGEVESLRLTVTVLSGYTGGPSGDLPVRNQVTIESPQHPVPGHGCVRNDQVTGDTDQCDEETLVPAPRPHKPHHPSEPSQPSQPGQPHQPRQPGLPDTGGPGPIPGLLAGLLGLVMLAAGATVILRPRGRRRHSGRWLE